VIESPALAQEIDAVFRTRVPADAYEVRLSDDGRLSWLERQGSESRSHDTEPGTRAWRRGWVRFLSALPIEWLL
jgi:putative cardiolipin synthase